MPSLDDVLEKLLEKETLMVFFLISATLLGISATLLAITKASVNFIVGTELEIEFKKIELRHLYSNDTLIRPLDKLANDLFSLYRDFIKDTLVKLDTASMVFLVSFVINSLLLIIRSGFGDQHKNTQKFLLLLSLTFMITAIIFLFSALKELGESLL